MDKKLIILTTIIGSFIGGYLPSFWQENMFSFSGVFFTTIGGCIGIWIGYKLCE